MRVAWARLRRGASVHFDRHSLCHSRVCNVGLVVEVRESPRTSEAEKRTRVKKVGSKIRISSLSHQRPKNGRRER